MFWIGLIVGIKLYVLAFVAMCFYVTHTFFNGPKEYWDAVDVLYDASVDRESELLVVHNDEIINGMTFEER